MNNNLIVDQEVIEYYADKCDRRYCTCSTHSNYQERLDELLALENITIVRNGIVGEEEERVAVPEIKEEAKDDQIVSKIEEEEQSELIVQEGEIVEESAPSEVTPSDD